MKQLTDEVFAQIKRALEKEIANYIEWDSEEGAPEYLHEAVLALVCAPSYTAQPVQVNAMLVEALQAAEKLEHEALVALSEATYELKVGNTYTTATDTYKANNDLIHRLDKILNSQYRDRKRTAITAAQQAQPEQRPTDDELWDETLKDRDAYHQFADDLAAQIAAITGVDIGEHSSMNNPWQEAMLAADDFIATQIKTLLGQQVQPEQGAK